jgi:putative ABC transport system permease protein
MARIPGVTAIVVLTLALGIGANTAMFSVVSAVLLRPLPYKNPDRLVTIRAQIPSMNIYGAFVEYNTFTDYWRAHNHSFQSVMSFEPGTANLTSGNEPERLSKVRVNAGFLSMLGLKAALGREFLPEEDQPGAPRVAMVSHRLWQRRFGGNPALIGRSIVVDRNSYTVVGVLPAKFEFYGSETDLYVPLAASSARVNGQPSVGVEARLKPGVSVVAAQAEIDALCGRWLADTHYPRDWGAHVWTLHDYAVRGVRTSLVVLAIAVGLVLLIACANVANLLLARSATRQREIAIRSALGASPGRVIRQLLTEYSLLGVAAAALGLLVAWGAVRALVAGSGYLPFQENVSIDGMVLWFTLGATLLTTLLFGMAPAMAAVHTNLVENLQEGGSAGEGVRRRGLRASLVVVEVALALLLTIGGTLTARSLMRLQAVNPGFNPDSVLTALLTLPQEAYPKPIQRVNFYKALLQRLNSAPGVKSASMVSHLPFSYSKSADSMIIEGAPPPPPGQKPIIFLRKIDPKYFETLQVPLLKGRFFDEHDPRGYPVAIINETMARRCWPGQDPVGRRFGGDEKNWMTVVGVVGDMRQSSLGEAPDMEAYIPHAEIPDAAMAIVVRTNMDPLRLAPTLRSAVNELDKELPVSDIGTLAGSIAHSTREQRLTVALLGAFALLALALAAIGIYGVISYTVTCRRREIGVRMTLGAERGRIIGMVVRHALLLGSVGVAIGIAAGLALTRFLRSMLFGVSATDPAVFVGVSLFLLAVTALAGYVPARRAARVDPLVALRHE